MQKTLWIVADASGQTGLQVTLMILIKHHALETLSSYIGLKSGLEYIGLRYIHTGEEVFKWSDTEVSDHCSTRLNWMEVHIK